MDFSELLCFLSFLEWSEKGLPLLWALSSYLVAAQLTSCPPGEKLEISTLSYWNLRLPTHHSCIYRFTSQMSGASLLAAGSEKWAQLEYTYLAGREERKAARLKQIGRDTTWLASRPRRRERKGHPISYLARLFEWNSFLVSSSLFFLSSSFSRPADQSCKAIQHSSNSSSRYSLYCVHARLDSQETGKECKNGV